MNATRDIYEVANQLEGYVGPGTPELLANFLMREGQFASDLADEIVRLRACISPQSPSGPADIITRLMPIADDARKAGINFNPFVDLAKQAFERALEATRKLCSADVLRRME